MCAHEIEQKDFLRIGRYALEKDKFDLFEIVVNNKKIRPQDKIDLLHIAAYTYPNEKAVTLLLEDNHKIDPNKPDQRLGLLLEKSITSYGTNHYEDKRNIKVIKLLIFHPKIKINTQGSCNMTPLHVSIAYHRDTVITALLLYHQFIDLTIQDCAGRTPLQAAIAGRRFGHQRLINGHLCQNKQK